MLDIRHFEYPTPFCTIDNFVTNDKYQKILSELHEIEPHLKDASQTGSARDNDRIAAKRKGLFLHEHEYVRAKSCIPSIFDKLLDNNVKDALASRSWIYNYLNNPHLESILISLYRDGDEYSYHKDSSVLSIIYYLFEDDFEGGEFSLGNVKVPIKTNSLIIFPSCVPHCVHQIKGPGKRWSITLFFTPISRTDLQFAPPNIHKYKNFISPDDLGIVRSVLANGAWTISGQSNPGDKQAFWNMNLNSNEFFTRHLFEKIPNGPWKLLRVYANGHTHGQDGQFHIDSGESNHWTFLLYTTDIDQNEVYSYNGMTIFNTHYGNTSIFPEPGLGVLFKSNILHKGLSPSFSASKMRTTVAWKLEKI